MTRKSAASAKAVKRENIPPMEDVFKIMREGAVAIIETNVETAKRVDNLFNLRDMARRFWGDDATHNSPSYYKQLHKLSVETYEKIEKIIKEKYTLEEFSKPLIDDWFKELIPTVDSLSDIDPQDMLDAMIIYMSVKPYGEKMLRDHQQIQEELERRKED